MAPTKGTLPVSRNAKISSTYNRTAFSPTASEAHGTTSASYFVQYPPPSGRQFSLTPDNAGCLNFLVPSSAPPSALSSYLVHYSCAPLRTATSTVLQLSSVSRLDQLDPVFGLDCGRPMPRSSVSPSFFHPTSLRHSKDLSVLNTVPE